MNFGHFECLSFDCYGTLIDWETGILSALQPILETHEVSAGHHALLELYGKAEAEIEAGPYRPYCEILKEVLSRIGDVFGFEPSRKELESFSTSVMNWPAFTDSSQALRALATQYRLIILSNIDDDLFRFSSSCPISMTTYFGFRRKFWELNSITFSQRSKSARTSRHAETSNT